MAVLHNVGARIEKIDQQIINLIEQRALLCQEALEEDSAALSAEHEMETVGLWGSEAEHRGLDETGLERICKAILAFCKKMGEQ